MAKMALEGIRVADWTIAAAGPSATMWLASLGAEVIKIEAREGDTGRGPQSASTRRPSYGVDTSGVKVRPLWEVLNHDKKSLAVNLKNEKGREVIYRLVKTCDVFATNQLPDTIEKLGMSYETLMKYNPKLIYGVGSVFGYKGPRRVVPASDVFGQAVSGGMTTTGALGDPLNWSTPGLGDFGEGFTLSSAIITALFHRERTGEGQMVEGTQLQAGMNIYHLAMLGIHLFLPEELRQADPYYNEGNYKEWRWERREARGIHTYYKCKDNKWVIVGGQQQKHWKALCQAIGEPELAEDPRFNTAEKREENGRELFALMEQIFASKTLAEWEERFHGADCSFCPVHRMRDLPNEPQVIANNYLYTFDHPVAGRVQYPGAPFTMHKTPASIRKAAPGLGEHTDEILFQLGYSVDEVLQLHEEQVV